MNHQSCAAKGAYGSREQHLLNRSFQRAAVNIYRTADNLVMLVFAPGRIREHFKLDLAGSELTISYQPPDGFPRQEWIRREYSRGGFARSFTLDDTIDGAAISARYADGVLEVILPVIPGKMPAQRDISVS